MSSRALHVDDLRAGRAALDVRTGRVRLKGAPRPRRLVPALPVLWADPAQCAVVLALRLVSEPNEDVPTVRQKIARTARTRRQRAGTRLALLEALGDPPPVPCVVVITRLGPDWPDDDNATAGAKHVRDGVADWLGVDDGDPRVRFVVERERARGAHRVVIQVVRNAVSCACCAGRGWVAP